MKTVIRLLPQAEKDFVDISHRDQARIIRVLRLLQDFPRAAQTAGFEEAPDVRRAVAGFYLIFYRFEPTTSSLLVHTIRHGHRRPVELTKLGPL